MSTEEEKREAIELRLIEEIFGCNYRNYDRLTDCISDHGFAVWQALVNAEYELGQRKSTKVITLCGSSRFTHVMAVCAWLLEKNENAIAMGLHLLPSWYSNGGIPDHLAEHEGVADQMDALHFAKIMMSDEIFVVNRGHYIGDSTKREIELAQSLNKPIRWYTHDTIGVAVEMMIQNALGSMQETNP